MEQLFLFFTSAASYLKYKLCCRGMINSTRIKEILITQMLRRYVLVAAECDPNSKEVTRTWVKISLQVDKVVSCSSITLARPLRKA